MSKSIIQRLKYIEKKQISELDKDQIEPIVYLNIFWDKANDIEYGFLEYDYFRNGALKSKAWQLGSYMNLQFIPKGEKKILVYNRFVSFNIIQRVNVVKSETQELIDKTEKANIKLPDIAKNNWGLR
tara:strand:- start:524 stop:904 length:381 start_codon:yes stop_codon:yes gene_type:complete